MEKERLVIKNFGPIKSVDLELGKMTILIGDNGTGKSTIAKVLAVCRYFSYIVDCGYKLGYSTSFDDGLRYWGIFDYLNEETHIEYSCNEYKLHVTYEIKDWEHDINENGEIVGEAYPVYAGAIVHMDWKSDKFNDLIEKLYSIQPWNREKHPPYFSSPDWFNWMPSSSFFEIDVKQVMENPFYFPTERGLQSVFSIGRARSANDSLYEQLADLYNTASNYSKPIAIEPFKIKYQNIDGRGFIQTKENGKLFPLQNSASGYQSTIPIVLVLKYYAEREKRYGRTYIIEEPETNLFPIRQKLLMEFLVESINKFNNQFILPTHSPYILSALNDLLLAHKKGQKNELEVDKIVRKESWLNQEDLSVYQLKEGEAFDIFDQQTGLIANNIIDDASDEMNDEFDELLEI